MLDYRFKVFQAVANHLNFTRAAAALHISQPAVTQHVKALEEHYGGALFHRGAGGIRLTPLGNGLWAAVTQAARLERETESLLRHGQPVLAGPLRLGASTTIAQYFLPGSLARFKQAHPRVDLTLRITNTREVSAGVRAGRLDLGLGEGPTPRRDLRVWSFFDDEIVCVAHPQHPLARAGRATPADLAATDLVMREPGSGTRDVVEHALRRAGVVLRRLRIVLETECSETIKGVVQAGVGVTFLSRLAIRPELAAKTLAIVPIAGLRLKRQFHFLHAQGPHPGGPAGVFIAQVEADLKSSQQTRKPGTSA